MFNKYWKRTRCACCKEWMECGFDNRIWLDNKAYHWHCYWRIIWPQKARLMQAAKKMKVAAK